MSLSKYLELSNQYDEFIYESYQVEKIEERLMLNFQYKIIGKNIETIVFNHRVSYYLKSKNNQKLRLELVKDLDALIFTIGLVESISYYKTVCPRKFYVNCGKLDQEQKKWWQKLFYNGLGEFIYRNGLTEAISMSDFVKFYSDESLPNIFEEIELEVSGNLIPVGGGKDSVVTIELLSSMKQDNLCFVMNPPEASYDCIRVAGYDEYLLARRYFDKRMMQMNEEGFLNGHVPFSAILGFISVLGAALTGKKYIPLSNERSANESTVIGMSVNHQYSKSFEFELDIHQYIKKHLVENIEYFSLLRQMHEVEIAHRFTKHKAYHAVFRSCNRGKYENSWCGVCSKCLFVNIILGPYMTTEALQKIFGHNLLENKELEPIFLELIGLKDVKPFECVGTIDEVRLSLKQIILEYDKTNRKYPYLLEVFLENVPLDSVAELDRQPTEDIIPEQYRQLIEG